MIRTCPSKVENNSMNLHDPMGAKQGNPIQNNGVKGVTMQSQMCNNSLKYVLT